MYTTQPGTRTLARQRWEAENLKRQRNAAAAALREQEKKERQK